MNDNYRIFGKIISVLNKDYPPRVSKKFTDRVMSEINKNKINFSKQTSNNYLNVAASMVFAVITSFVLVNYNPDNSNLVSSESTVPEPVGDNLIQKVIEKDPCYDDNDMIIKKDACD
jgi:hypothetical protein|tara:strand:- start:134 stop:484 length:351 start_codon:yes stop_codon:yes gene_type:complete